MSRSSALLFEVKKVEDSSQIKHLAYNPDTRLLLVLFHTGGPYIYTEVSPVEYESLCNAESKGSYFSQSIKSSHPCVNLSFLPELLK